VVFLKGPVVRVLLVHCCSVEPWVYPYANNIYVLQPPIATSGETASTSQMCLKGPIVRDCWCTLGFEPWVYPYAKKWFRCWDRNLLDGMSRWFPSKTEIQKWIEDQEKDFAEIQNKNPNLSTEDWLGRYIFTNAHEILFAGIHQELYEWLARLADTQFQIRYRTPMVLTSLLIKKIKRVDNVVSRVVDH
jgi:hypothetical protein